jgi:GH24 family phage-related lysozyme (muramidase)
MSKNRFLSISKSLNQPAGKRSLSKAKSRCPQVSEAPVGSDLFVIDMLEFFFQERLSPDQLNNRLRELAAEAVWRATTGSRAMDHVPRPPAGRPTFVWLVSQAVQIAIRRMQNQCIYEAVRRVVQGTLRAEFEGGKADGPDVPRGMNYYANQFTGNNTTSDNGINFIIQFEGFSAALYNDPAGHCTIGYGTLVHRGNCNGSESAEFRAGITRDRALELLRAEVRSTETAINNAVTVSLNQCQFDALVSFAYNIGTGAFRESTLLRKLNQGDYAAVPSELRRWIYGGGQVLPGLVRRRNAESELFTSGVYSTGQSLSLGSYGYQFTEPRGIRNNNPGNIRINRNNDWEGRVPLDQNTDHAFEQFTSYAYGVRALIILLRNYIRSGRNTITRVFEAYAPPGENNTQSYINFVAQRLGIGANDTLAISKTVLRALAQAIAKMENGQECISDQQFDDGWALVPESIRTSIPQSLAYSNGNYSSGMSAGDRALVVVIENGGLDPGVSALADYLLGQMPIAVPAGVRERVVTYLRDGITRMTDNVLESADLYLNGFRNAAPGYYGEVVILRNNTATKADLRANLQRLTENNKTIDLYILTHGGQSGSILINSPAQEWLSASDIEAMRMPNGSPLRIRSVYQMNCYGGMLNDAWRRVGAQAVAGSPGVNYLPEPTTFFVFRNWKNNSSFHDAVTNAFNLTVSLIKELIRSSATVLGGAVGGVVGAALGRLLASIATNDFENKDFVRTSRPQLVGNTSVTIQSDTLTFTQSVNAPRYQESVFEAAY